MTEENNIEKVKKEFLDLNKAFSDTGKIIGHRFTYITLFQDIVILALSHVQINKEISNEKIIFLSNFLNFKSLKNSKYLLEDFKKNSRIKPCPYPLGYSIPVSFKIAINIDIMTGRYYISKIYIDFIKDFFELLNNSFDDIDFYKIQEAMSFLNEIDRYILSTILNYL